MFKLTLKDVFLLYFCWQFEVPCLIVLSISFFLLLTPLFLWSPLPGQSWAPFLMRTLLLIGNFLCDMRVDEFSSNILPIEYVERASFHSSFFSRLLLKRFGSYTLQFYFLPRSIHCWLHVFYIMNKMYGIEIFP